MTRVSWFGRPTLGHIRPNRVKLQTVARLAYAVLPCAVMLLFASGSALGLAVTAAGCVVPVPLELETADAGPTAQPELVSAAPGEFDFPGPLALDPGDQRRMSLTLRDRDLEDTLYVRMFVDYGLPNQTGFVSDCVAVPSGALTRIADCSTSAICNSVTDSDKHVLEAMVSDREFLPTGDPRAAGQDAFRELPIDAAFDYRFWQLTCTQGTN